MSHIRIDKQKAVKKWAPVLENMGVGEDRKSTRLELQSHSELVCRLLLEKKKHLNSNHITTAYAYFCFKNTTKHKSTIYRYQAGAANDRTAE